MSQSNYIGINGLVTQTKEEIVAGLEQELRRIYGDDINIEQNSSDGQLINVYAQQKAETLDLITQYYNNLNADTVVGLPQQILYKLNGLRIKAYTYSYLQVQVTVSEPVTLKGLDDDIENPDGVGYTIKDSNNNRWILTETTTIDSGSSILNFRAALLGSVTALPNTVNIMETVIRGVVSVNNPANNYITGATGETDAEFRTRRAQSMAIPSQGFDESIESQLRNLTDVVQARVYDNRENEEVDGIPAHTIWVIVSGGERSDIARVIYNNLPPGIPMKGDIEVNIQKSNGDLQLIKFDTGLPIPLYVRATLHNFTSTPLDTDYIKSRISTINYEIGDIAQTSNITTFIKDVVAETATPYNVEISLDGEDWSEYLTPSVLNGYFTIAAENVTLTVE